MIQHGFLANKDKTTIKTCLDCSLCAIHVALCNPDLYKPVLYTFFRKECIENTYLHTPYIRE